MVYKQKKSKNWWYKFTWNGEVIRESTKQTNKRVAEQMEAAHKTNLAKGDVGIREKKLVPTLKEFAEGVFRSHVGSTFAAKVQTLRYYEHGIKAICSYPQLANLRLDAITTQTISDYVAKRRADGLQVSSINRELQALRRMFALAVEWGKVERQLPKVRMLPGERHRERVLSPLEESKYLKAAQEIGDRIEAAWQAAIRKWGPGNFLRPDSYRLRDVATILVDCGIRPEECFRLKWSNICDGLLEIQHGKTDNARRRIPLPNRVAAILDMRRTVSSSEWVFPASTKTGHIEPSTLKKPHVKACKGNAKDDEKNGEKRYDVQPFPLYTFRHTCLTRWAPRMDPWALAYLAGHRDMSTTKRYIHPQTDTLREAMEQVREVKGGHTPGHTSDSDRVAVDSHTGANNMEQEELDWRARRDSNPRPIGSKPIALSS
jgi:integrase